MKHSRKDFIKLGASAAAGIGVTSIGSLSFFSSCKEEAGKLKKFGLQLYTLRDVIAANPKETLKQVASYGYKQIEGYEGPQGMFWSMSNTDFKKYMDDLGMEFVSSHCDIKKDFGKKVDEAAAIGMKYLIYPWEGPGKTIDYYKQLAEEFNKSGEICRKAGLRFAFHNHDFTFHTLDGIFPQDVLLENTDASLVDFEMDIYWVVTAGQNPESWLKKYKDRFRLCHVKDRSKTPVEDNGKNSVDLGTGSIDWGKVLQTAKTNGMEYYIVEQEAYPNGNPMDAVKVDAEFMKKLKL